MQFSEIPGNREVKERLVKAADEGRVAHAYLFHGEEGSAALPLAMAFAQYLLCTAPENGDSCGRCAACQKVQRLIHPDVLYSFPVVKAGRAEKDPRSAVFLDEWRKIMLEDPYIGPAQWYEHLGVENKQGMIYKDESEEILAKMSLTPYEADRKVLILWLPEKMNPKAANSLLKLIEEPPGPVVFLLVSIAPAQVLPTIVSRCQGVQVPRTDDESMRSWLAEKYGLKGEDLERAVVRAGGNLLTARAIVREQEEENRFFDLFRSWMRLSYALDIPGLVRWVDEVSELGREKQKMFLTYVLHVLRENLMLNIFRAEAKNPRLTGEEYDFSRKFSEFVHPGNLEDIRTLLEEAWEHIAGNVYGKLVFMDVSLKLNKLLKK